MKLGVLATALACATPYACKPAEAPLESPAPTGGQPSATLGDDASTAREDQAANRVRSGRALPCDHPELWLAMYSKQELGAAYCAACSEKSSGDCESGRLEWEPLRETDQQLMSRYGCAELDYLARAIPAFHGQPVMDPKWKSYFASQSWYDPKPDFDLSQLPAEAARNTVWATQLRDRCARDFAPIRDSDERAVVSWFLSKQAGKVQLPKQLYVDGEPASPKRFLEFIGAPELFRYDERTPLQYVESKNGARTVLVGTSAAGLDCLGFDEDCEGYEWLEISLDAESRVVALGAGAAACPFVYVSSAGANWSFRGEILRNLRSEKLATTQTLSLGSGLSCSGTIHVRLVEEKKETTFLDHVALLVDGIQVAPDACRTTSASYCEADGSHLSIPQGNLLELSFTPPPGASCNELRLEASGYYVPY